MLKSIVTATAMVALLTGSAFAADIYKGDVITHQHGAWTTSELVGDTGKPLCYAENTGQDRFFSIKYQSGSDTMFFHLFKSGWNLPELTRVDVNMQVDNAPIITYPMFARPGIGGGTVLEYDFTHNTDPKTGETYLTEFLNLIRSGVQVKFFFPEGNEGAWIGGLNGAAAALDDMGECMKGLIAGGTPQATQPGTPATQPGGLQRQQMAPTEKTTPKYQGL